MHKPSIEFRPMRHAQRGVSLMELLVAATISIIAVSAMLIVMANTLGTGSQTIQMTRLSQEMRAGMQIMTRELRRANYHANFLSCYGDVACRTTLGIATHVAEINITDSGNSDCFWFWYDRPQSGTETAVTGETVAAFRRDTNASGIGSLQMKTTATSMTSANCASDSGWVDITDTDIIDVLTFNVSDANSFTEQINEDGDTQSVERITLSLTARLVRGGAVPTWLQTTALETKTLDHYIQVRNNITSAAP